MAQSSRIPTPLKQHLYRFRVGTLPFISFAACVFLMMFLWQRQAYHGSFVGEVAATTFEVKADIAGQLTFPADRYWQLYDPVQKGTVIARLDDAPTRARLATVQAEAARLQAESAAAHTDLKNQQLALQQRHDSDELRVQLEFERRRVDLLQLGADILTDEADLRGLQASLNIFEGLSNLRPTGLISNTNVTDLQRQHSVAQTRIKQNKRILEDLKQLYQVAESRVAGFGPLELPEVETVFGATIRAGIAVQESLMNEISVELDNLSITAPVSGIISAIYYRPGQRIVAGDPILMIALADSKYIVSYVREHQERNLRAGMSVGLRLRQPGSPEFTSQIAEVGPHVEQVPTHQLKDQATIEWATPIKIPIPSELQQEDVRPGQLLNVIIREPRQPMFWARDGS